MHFPLCPVGLFLVCSVGLGLERSWAHWRTACTAAARGCHDCDPAASEVNIRAECFIRLKLL